MMRFIVAATSHRLRNLLIIGISLLAVGFAVVVYASVPGADGLIHGCYQTNGGQLRVVDTAAVTGCRIGEVAVAWPATAPTVACPSGTRSFVGVCIETTVRTAALHFQAKFDCADEGSRLPLPGELLGFRELDGITLASGEWTDDLGDTEPHFLYVTVGEAGDGIADSAVESNPYRCVTGPQLQ